MYKSNCHTHTNYCDGKNTAREMIEAAVEKGFVSLGFSGHSPMKDKNDWTMTVEGAQEYMREIKALQEEYKDKIDVLCGIELDADYFGIDPGDYDYVIGSVHQLKKNGVFYDVDYTAEALKKATDEFFGGSFNEMSRWYYNTLADFVINTRVDVVGHIDLITKFNVDKPLFDESNTEYRQIVLDAVDRILSAKPDILFEVNTGAMFRVGKKTPYPAEFILCHIYKKGGRVTLTSDSHCTNSIDFAFVEALEYIENCGFKEVYYLTSSGLKKYSIK